MQKGYFKILILILGGPFIFGLYHTVKVTKNLNSMLKEPNPYVVKFDTIISWTTSDGELTNYLARGYRISDSVLVGVNMSHIYFKLDSIPKKQVDRIIKTDGLSLKTYCGVSGLSIVTPHDSHKDVKYFMKHKMRFYVYFMIPFVIFLVVILAKGVFKGRGDNNM